MTCPEGSIEWIANIFGDCVVTKRDKWSFAVGMLSNIIWLVSSTPQFVQNYRTKSVDGQSPYFFSLLLIGSICSLIGLIVNKGLATQIIQSIIYVLLDSILFGQYVYYRNCYKSCHEDSFEGIQDGHEIDESENSSKFGRGVAFAGVSAAVDFAYPYTGKELVGTMFGWVSTTIFVASRIPQLKKNIQTKMVKDVNPLYITLSVFGNGSYLASLWIKKFTAQYNWNQMPWIVGAAFPMLCDITALVQMAIWGRGETEEHPEGEDISEEEEDDAETTIMKLKEL
jgi:uncharacterized protein with PQ loop repeat